MRVRVRRSHTTRIATGEWQWWIELYTQAYWRHAVGKAYHAYDMNKLVHAIAHRIERPHGKFDDGTPITLPICVEQDVRCERLNNKGTKVVALLEVTEKEYAAIGDV